MHRTRLLVEQKIDELQIEAARILRLVPYECDASRHLERSVNSVSFNTGEGIATFKPRKKAEKFSVRWMPWFRKVEYEQSKLKGHSA